MKETPPKQGKPLSFTERWLIVGIVVLVVAIGALLILRRNQVGNRTAADPNNTQQVALGQQVYAANCASCHGAKLEGQPNWHVELPTGGLPAPPHDETGHTWHHPDEYLFNVTKNGGQTYSPANYKNNMPAFGGRLTDEQVWAVLAYIRSRWPPEIQTTQARQQSQ
jgi:mono/diheme cytochrome c family protein